MARGRLRSPRPARSVEVEYERRIRRIGDSAWRVLESEVFPAMSEVETRSDDLADAVRGSLLEVGRRLRDAHRTNAIARWVDGAGAAADRTHSSQFYSHLADAIGVSVSVDEERAPGVLRSWTGDGTSLIKSVRDSVVPGLAREIEEAFNAGVRHEELARRWRARGLPLEFGTLEGRARVIARDQLGKLNGRLTEARQRDIGIEAYTWRTVGDLRVRDRHEARDRRVYQWDAAPSGGHPGQEVLCRCSAEAVVDMLAVAGRSNVVLMPARAPAVLPAAAALPGFALSGI